MSSSGAKMQKSFDALIAGLLLQAMGAKNQAGECRLFLANHSGGATVGYALSLDAPAVNGPPCRILKKCHPIRQQSFLSMSGFSHGFRIPHYESHARAGFERRSGEELENPMPGNGVSSPSTINSDAPGQLVLPFQH
jgi:hypothetical protein